MSIDKNIEIRMVRSFGEVLGETFSIIRHCFKVMIKTLLIVAGPPLVALAIIQSLLNVEVLNMYGDLFSQKAGADPNSILGVKYILFWFLVILMNILLQLVAYEYMVLYKEKDYREITVNDLLHAVRKDFWMIFFTNFGLIILVMAAFIILAMIIALMFYIHTVPGVLSLLSVIVLVIYIGVVFSFIPIIRINERVGLFVSIGRSVNLMKGHWWWTFLLIFVFFVILFMASVILGIPYYVLFGLSIFHRASGGQESEIVRILFIVTGSISMVAYFFNVVILMGIGFQYFSIVEKKEGTRLLEKIETAGGADV